MQWKRLISHSVPLTYVGPSANAYYLLPELVRILWQNGPSVPHIKKFKFMTFISWPTIEHGARKLHDISRVIIANLFFKNNYSEVQIK